MAEAIWYYAVDDQEKGPVAPAQLKALADAGELKPDDLVWREGLDDWKPAREVSGLFAGAGSKAKPQPADPAPPPPTEPAPPLESAAPIPEAAGPAPVAATDAMPRTAAPRAGTAAALIAARAAARAARPSLLTSLLQPLSFGLYVGQPLLLVGLVLVLLAKGCDSVGNRYVQQLNAKLELKQNQFQDDWDAQRQEIEQTREQLQADGGENQLELEDLGTKLDLLNEDKRDEKAALERGAWRDLTVKARDASAGNKVWAYYREAMFVFGTIVLTVGLLAVGFSGEGAQKWICLIMLAIVTFSLYVGGTAWVGSLTGLVR